MKRLLFCIGAIGVALLLMMFKVPKITKALKTETLKLNFQEGDPLSLHPHIGIDLRCRVLERLLFEGLTRVDSQGVCQLAAAEHLEISPDQTTYTFTLRPHVWSNGEPVTALQFANAWKWALEPDSLCMRSDLFYIIKNGKRAKLGQVSLDEVGIDVIDERTLRVTLEHPAPYFLDLLTHPVYSPLFSKESVPTVFNGPYTLQQWKHDVAIDLFRNPSYWDVESVFFPVINFSFIKDPMTVLSLFEKGEIDFIGDPLTTLPLDALSSAIDLNQIQFQDVARTYWIYVNTQQFPYTSRTLRKAFGLALDRKQLTDHIFLGCLPHHSPVPRNLSLLTEEEMKVSVDETLARELFEEGLKELGLTRETLPQVILSHSTITGQKTLAEAIQQRWSEVFGIDVKIEGSEWSVFASHFNRGTFQMGGCLRSAVYNDPLYHLEIFKERDFPYNASFWESDAYKQLIETASQASDQGARQEYLRAAEKMLIDEMPVIPIYVDTYKYMTNRGLKGFIIDKSGCIDFREAKF